MDSDIDNLHKLTSSKLKIQLCFILGNGEYTLNEIHQQIETEYSVKKNKETIYRALESLLESNLVEKKYDSTEKVLKYSLNVTRIEVDFINQKLTISYDQ